MTGRQANLLLELQNEVRDDSKPISTALRTCLLLAAKTDSSGLRAWASKELEGYSSGDQVPAYRTVAADIQAAVRDVSGFAQHDVSISMFDIPAELRRPHMKNELVLGESVFRLEEMLAEADDRGRIRTDLPLGLETAQLMTAYKSGSLAGGRYERLYWNVSQSSVRTVLDQVRNKLTALVGELMANLPDDQEVPSKGATENAYQVVIQGNADGAVFNNAQAARGATNTATTNAPASPEAESKPAKKEKRAVRIWKWTVDLSVVVAGICAPPALVVAWFAYKLATH
ncbi:MAG: hypothetical protein JWP44_4779 [Mucilaginibacter sp.]|nr:hypothetical protein [Mucilaginibacter sp.]